ncbi:MAG: hypothetical protein ACRC5T_05290 [Cetobacterium sp.]
MDNHSNWTQVVALIISSIASISVTYLKMRYDLRNKMVDKETAFKSTKLINHIFFTNIISLENTIYTNFSYESKGKEELCRFILFQLCKKLESNYKDLVHDIDAGNITDLNELKRLNIEKLELTYRYVRDIYLLEGLSDGDKEVLKVVVIRFNLWNGHRHDHLIETIKGITTSEYYTDTKTMQSVVLDSISAHITELVRDARITMDDMSGTLRGRVFRGHLL